MGKLYRNLLCFPPEEGIIFCDEIGNILMFLHTAVDTVLSCSRNRDGQDL